MCVRHDDGDDGDVAGQLFPLERGVLEGVCFYGREARGGSSGIGLGQAGLKQQ